MEESLIWYFLQHDLERIHLENIGIHQVRLASLQAELGRATTANSTLLREVERMETQLDSVSESIRTKSVVLTERVEALEKKKHEVQLLKNKLADIGISLRAAEGDRSQLEYDLIIKTHRRREQDDKSFRRVKVFLTLLSIFAVLIALLLLSRR